MRSWFIHIVRNEGPYMLGLVVLSLVMVLFRVIDWASFATVTPAVLLLGAIVATARHFGRTKSDPVSIEEIERRAKRSFPPLAQVDATRPLIGVGAGGEYAGCLALITIAKSRGSWTGSIGILSGRFLPNIVEGLKRVPIDDFKEQLSEWDIRVLPQSEYSDMIARTQFGKRAVHVALDRRGAKASANRRVRHGNTLDRPDS